MKIGALIFCLIGVSWGEPEKTTNTVEAEDAKVQLVLKTNKESRFPSQWSCLSPLWLISHKQVNVVTVLVTTGYALSCSHR